MSVCSGGWNRSLTDREEESLAEDWNLPSRQQLPDRKWLARWRPQQRNIFYTHTQRHTHTRRAMSSVWVLIAFTSLWSAHGTKRPPPPSSRVQILIYGWREPGKIGKHKRMMASGRLIMADGRYCCTVVGRLGLGLVSFLTDRSRAGPAGVGARGSTGTRRTVVIDSHLDHIPRWIGLDTHPWKAKAHWTQPATATLNLDQLSVPAPFSLDFLFCCCYYYDCYFYTRPT